MMMKHFVINILALFTIFSPAISQPSELFTKTWKMEKMTSELAGNTSTLFHKDSAANILSLSSLNYLFFNNGTYTTTSDTTSNQGTWALNATADSAVIDSVSYLLIELSATHFTTRGFALRLMDTTGTMDTAFHYIVLYPAAPAGPLPVSLVNFTGKYSTNLVTLNWSTGSEQQNKEFQVQYSANGINFETIGTVPGKGNSTLVSDYTFNTTHYQAGKNHYRLKQVDPDGHSTISSVVTIGISASGQQVISLSPNPASNKISVAINQPVNGSLQLVLTTVTGRQVWNTALAGNTASTTIFLPSLTKGVYIVYITNNKGEKIFNNKLVIQ